MFLDTSDVGYNKLEKDIAMIKKHKLIFWGIGAVLSSLAIAGDHAHQHGVAQINLALADSDLLIELHASGEDLLGFEHAPHTSKEKAKQKAVNEELKQVSRLLTLPESAGCTVVTQDVSDTLKEKHHGEIQATYRFSCKNPEKIDEVTVHFFKTYPGLEQIKWQAMVNKSQKSGTLTPTTPTLSWVK